MILLLFVDIIVGITLIVSLCNSIGEMKKLNNNKQEDKEDGN